MVIGEKNTSLTIGLCLAIGGAVVGIVWWAAVINTKLDGVLVFEAAHAAAIEVIGKDVEDLKTRVKVLEQIHHP